MNYFHIFANDENEKFSLSYKKFIEENLSKEEHKFMNIGDLLSINADKGVRVVGIQNKIVSLLSLNKMLYQADKIIIHGLFLRKLILILFFQPWLLRKCYWCIWGGDLYYYKYRSKNVKSNIYELFRKYVIKNMHGLITQLKGDYELAQEWYGAKGKYYYSFMYPSNLYKEYDLKKVEKNPGKTYIQIGNSADETNNHIEVFEKLSKNKDENIEIICPLSYSGKEEYINQVIEAGYKIFGKEKFTPITEFMPFERYLELLAKVDIAIFNHKRQRGLGNITTLLGLGKKVYIREEITTWQFCKDHDLKVYSANDNYDDLFEEMDEMVKRKNIENMRTKFSEKKLVEDWKKIFNGVSVNDKTN